MRNPNSSLLGSTRLAAAVPLVWLTGKDEWSYTSLVPGDWNSQKALFVAAADQLVAVNPGDDAIRVNCVAPGLVRTPLGQFLTANEVARKASVAMHPLGRLGEPGDIASAICWLLSPEQKKVTGQVLHADGGLSSVQAR